MVLTERNENSGEMTTEEFPVKANRVWKGEEMEKCEALSRNSFTASNEYLQEKEVMKRES